jgi:outer membrane protein assembly factor BamB
LVPLLPAQEPAPFLLGDRLLDGKELKECAKLPPGTIGGPQWRGDGTVHHAAGLVDPARRLLLTVDAKQLRLGRIGGERVWSRPLADVRLEAAPVLPQAVLGRDVAVLPDQDGHLVGVAVANGNLLWRTDTDGHGELVQDGELVAALATQKGGRRLHAWALANGAQALDTPAPKAAEFVTLGPHGIFVGGPSGAAVFARGGPRMFAIDPPVHDALADASGFYVQFDAEVVAFDRSGKERWRVRAERTSFTAVRPVLDPTGRLVLVTFSAYSDSGAELVAHEPERGEVAWRRSLPPLGIAHSKYWHEVVAVARGDALVVASHAAGGQWLAVLDGTNGEVRQRVTFPH